MKFLIDKISTGLSRFVTTVSLMYSKLTNHLRGSNMVLPSIAILICALIRLGYYRFAFFPILDDWIQYGTYAQYARPWSDVYVGFGLYTFRPLAGILDVFFWSRITFLAQFLMVVLHASSCILLIRAARKIDIKLGAPFAIIYMFLPINSEATMWLSASTRLVVPMFFLALALNFAVEKRNATNITLFGLTLLISLAFYEQIAIIAISLAFLVGLRMKSRSVIITTAASGIAIAAYYAIFMSQGPGGSRALMEEVALLEQLNILWIQFAQGWGQAHWELFANGLIRGMRLLFNSPIYLTLAMLGSTFFAFAYMREDEMIEEEIEEESPRKQAIMKMYCGFALFILPLAIFTLASGHLYAFRNCFPSLIGLALMLDGVLSFIPKQSTWLPIASGVLVFMFLVVGVSQTSDYRAVSLTDQAFVEGLLPQMLQDYLIIDRIPSLVVEQNTRFAEHILSATSSGWAITGVARHLSGNLALPTAHVMWTPQKKLDNFQKQ